MIKRGRIHLKSSKTKDQFFVDRLVEDVQTQGAVVDAETLQSPSDGKTWVRPEMVMFVATAMAIRTRNWDIEHDMT